MVFKYVKYADCKCDVCGNWNTKSVYVISSKIENKKYYCGDDDPTD